MNKYIDNQVCMDKACQVTVKESAIHKIALIIKLPITVV